MIKNIVFDWSGTLSDDFEMVFHTVRAMFHDIGVAPVNFPHFQEVVDIPYDAYIKKLFGDSPQTMAKFADRGLNRDLFERHFRSLGYPEPIRGVGSALQLLHEDGYNLLVFSAHHQRFIEEENARFFSGKNFFSRIFGSAGNKLESVSQLVTQAGILPSETIMVGDTAHDVLAARKAGMAAVAVLSGYHIREQLTDAKPDFLLRSVCELPALLRSIPSQQGFLRA